MTIETESIKGIRNFKIYVNELPSSFNIAWYDQKASFAFPAYLAVDIKDTMINPHLLAHISPDALNTLVER